MVGRERKSVGPSVEISTPGYLAQVPDRRGTSITSFADQHSTRAEKFPQIRRRSESHISVNGVYKKKSAQAVSRVATYRWLSTKSIKLHRRFGE